MHMLASVQPALTIESEEQQASWLVDKYDGWMWVDGWMWRYIYAYMTI